jgi:hypothetical protein
MKLINWTFFLILMTILNSFFTHFKTENDLLPLAFEEGKVQIIHKIISMLGNNASKTSKCFQCSQLLYKSIFGV